MLWLIPGAYVRSPGHNAYSISITGLNCSSVLVFMIVVMHDHDRYENGDENVHGYDRAHDVIMTVRMVMICVNDRVHMMIVASNDDSWEKQGFV